MVVSPVVGFIARLPGHARRLWIFRQRPPGQAQPRLPLARRPSRPSRCRSATACRTPRRRSASSCSPSYVGGYQDSTQPHPVVGRTGPRPPCWRRAPTPAAGGSSAPWAARSSTWARRRASPPRPSPARAALHRASALGRPDLHHPHDHLGDHGRRRDQAALRGPLGRGRQHRDRLGPDVPGGGADRRPGLPAGPPALRLSGRACVPRSGALRSLRRRRRSGRGSSSSRPITSSVVGVRHQRALQSPGRAGSAAPRPPRTGSRCREGELGPSPAPRRPRCRVNARRAEEPARQVDPAAVPVIDRGDRRLADDAAGQRRDRAAGVAEQRCRCSRRRPPGSAGPRRAPASRRAEEQVGEVSPGRRRGRAARRRRASGSRSRCSGGNGPASAEVGVDVRHLADRAVGDQLGDPADGRVESASTWPPSGRRPRSRASVDQLRRRSARSSVNGFSHSTALPASRQSQGGLVVRRVRGGHVDHVHVGRRRRAPPRSRGRGRCRAGRRTRSAASARTRADRGELGVRHQRAGPRRTAGDPAGGEDAPARHAVMLASVADPPGCPRPALGSTGDRRSHRSAAPPALVARPARSGRVRPWPRPPGRGHRRCCCARPASLRGVRDAPASPRWPSAGCTPSRAAASTAPDCRRPTSRLGRPGAGATGRRLGARPRTPRRRVVCAAVREVFEEAGVLLAGPVAERRVRRRRHAATTGRRTARALEARQVGLRRAAAPAGLRAARRPAAAVVPVDHAGVRAAPLRHLLLRRPAAGGAADPGRLRRGRPRAVGRPRRPPARAWPMLPPTRSTLSVAPPGTWPRWRSLAPPRRGDAVQPG